MEILRVYVTRLAGATDRIRAAARRASGGWRSAPVALMLAAACAASFAAQRILAGVEFRVGFPFDQPVLHALGLHPALLFSEGFFWQPATYVFLHGSWLHLLCNALGLALFGRALEPGLGARRFLALFFAGSIAGGILWAACNGLWHLRTGATMGLCVGASGGVYGLVGACAALFADRTLHVLVLFIPLRMRGKWLAVVVLLLTAADAALGLTKLAHAAHLGGFAAGWLLGRRWRRSFFEAEAADAL